MGAILVNLRRNGISPEGSYVAFVDPAHGGYASFVGVVRNHNLGRRVTRVSYDALLPLAHKALTEIGQEAVKKWTPDLHIRIVHAYGDVNVGQASVVINTSAPHRREALRACEYIIEELKKRVPIWKREIYEDGESEWVKGHALCQCESDMNEDK